MRFFSALDPRLWGVLHFSSGKPKKLEVFCFASEVLAGFFHGFRLPTLKNSSFFGFLALAAINRSFFQAASGKLLALDLKCFVRT